jgi:hypothetical protein
MGIYVVWAKFFLGFFTNQLGAILGYFFGCDGVCRVYFYELKLVGMGCLWGAFGGVEGE